MKQPSKNDIQYINEVSNLLEEVTSYIVSSNRRDKQSVMGVLDDIKHMIEESICMLEMGQSIEGDKMEIDKLFNSII